MSEIHPNGDYARGGRLISVCVGFVSFSVLTLEIGLTRYFSVMFDYHYTFLLISLAILGMGIGALYAHYRFSKRADSADQITLIIRSVLFMSLAVLALTVLTLKVPGFQSLVLAVPLAFAPFFFGGVFLSSAFKLFTGRSAKLYAADLIGASFGSILVIALLTLGGINLNLIVALLLSLSALVLTLTFPSRIGLKTTGGVLAVVSAALFILQYITSSLGPIPLSKGSHKEMAHMLSNPEGKARIVESRSSAFGRTDLIADAKNPDQMGIFLDGTSGTAVYRFDGDPRSLNRPEFTHFSGYFPFELLAESEKEKVLIIGSGGGREVLVSLLSGAKEITAVEVNPDLVELMRRYSSFNGGIYNGFPGVKVVVEEGRNYVRRDMELYDLIMLSIPVTKTSRSPEGFALTENFLFTVESIRDYMERLKPNGRLVVVAHNEVEIFRLIFTSLEALRRTGIEPSAAMERIYTVGPSMFPVFVLKKSPLTPLEARWISENMHRHGFLSRASYIPFVEQMEHLIPLEEGMYQRFAMLNQNLYLLQKGTVTPKELIGLSNANIVPVTDDNPFFYNDERGVPSVVIALLVFSILTLLWSAFSGQNASKEGVLPFILLFSFLGAGFMLIEIPLIQKFILFLGQPVYSMALLLFSLLLGAGLGSLFSGAFKAERSVPLLRLAPVLIAVMVTAYTLSLNPIFSSLLGGSFIRRALMSVALLLPLGFLMGIPFPLAMALLGRLGRRETVPRAWAINGVSSVLGSGLAIALAVGFGFTASLYTGAVLYLLAFLSVMLGFNRKKIQQGG
jgi:spermidine synthase